MKLRKYASYSKFAAQNQEETENVCVCVLTCIHTCTVMNIHTYTHIRGLYRNRTGNMNKHTLRGDCRLTYMMWSQL